MRHTSSPHVLVKNEYEMTKLRAVFALAEVVRKTGLGRELMHRGTRTLEKSQMGTAEEEKKDGGVP
jgi:hypothetical protein